MKKRNWSDQQVEVLQARYPYERAQVVADSLGIPVRAVYQKANALGIKKAPEFFLSDISARILNGHQNEAMISTQFKPGHITWNKGMKGLQIEGSKPTRFAPGQRPHTWLPIGSYRITADGSLEQKVADVPGPNNLRWHPVARLVWSAAFGQIPDGHMVVFKRGRQSNVLEKITPDALECINRAENARRNHPYSLSPELGKLVQLRGAMTRQVNKRSKEQTQGSTL